MATLSTRMKVEQLKAQYENRLDKMPDYTLEARARRAFIQDMIEDLSKILEGRT